MCLVFEARTATHAVNAAFQPAEAFDLIARYYPRAAIPAKTQFPIEAILGSKGDEPARPG